MDCRQEMNINRSFLVMMLMALIVSCAKVDTATENDMQFAEANDLPIVEMLFTFPMYDGACCMRIDKDTISVYSVFDALRPSFCRKLYSERLEDWQKQDIMQIINKIDSAILPYEVNAFYTDTEMCYIFVDGEEWLGDGNGMMDLYPECLFDLYNYISCLCPFDYRDAKWVKSELCFYYDYIEDVLRLKTYSAEGYNRDKGISIEKVEDCEFEFMKQLYERY